MSSDDMFDAVEGSLAFDPSPGSLGSTPIDCSGVVDDPAAVPVALPPQGVPKNTEGFRCPVCPDSKRPLKTKSGFTRHMMQHKLNDFSITKPMQDYIVQQLPGLFTGVLADIQKEPAVGEMGDLKRKFITAMLERSVSSNEVKEFLDAISRPLLEIILKKEKVMPSAQYEQALAKLNHLLSRPAFYEETRGMMLLCVHEMLRNIPAAVAQRLLWRLTSNLMLKIQESVFISMKKAHLDAHATFEISELEKEEFKIHIGKILRVLYRFGMKSQNSVWASRCRSLRERFIVALDAESNEEYIVSSEEFVDGALWKVHITLTDACFSLFLGLEKIMQSLQKNNSPCTADIVFNSLTYPENIINLSHMRTLSHGIMSEDVALDFLRELVKSLTALSAEREARKQLSKATEKQKASVVALRSDLKRNPKSSAQHEKESMKRKTSSQDASAASAGPSSNQQEKPSRRKKVNSPASSVPGPSSNQQEKPARRKKVNSPASSVPGPSSNQEEKPSRRKKVSSPAASVPGPSSNQQEKPSRKKIVSSQDVVAPATRPDCQETVTRKSSRKRTPKTK